jgi:uncharacterized protein YebE (UPF0316 family)
VPRKKNRGATKKKVKFSKKSKKIKEQEPGHFIASVSQKNILRHFWVKKKNYHQKKKIIKKNKKTKTSQKS